MTVLASPVAIWRDQLGLSAATLMRMVPYKTTAGYWILLPATSAPPVGATRGAVVGAAPGYDTLLTSTTDGKRVTRRGDGVVLTY